MSKVSKLTREEWLRLGAQSKLVLKILANYEQELYDKLGGNHVTKKVQNAYKSVDTAKVTLDDMVFDYASKLFDDKEIADVIFGEPIEEKALDALERVTDKWSAKYPNFMKIWKQNWDAISPIFKFSAEVRKVIYTTNAIESLNATYRKLNRQRSVFPSDTALLKALYLSTFEATKKWTMPIRNWGQVYGELCIMYEVRLPE